MTPDRTISGIMLNSDACDKCDHRRDRSCDALYPGGSWPALGNGQVTRPCPAVLKVPDCSKAPEGMIREYERIREQSKGRDRK